MYTPRVTQTIPVLGVLLCTTLLEARDKTDIVSLKNGDRVTGEIKELQRGKLTVKTESMGTVSIEWKDVIDVASQYEFSVELENGELYFGPIDGVESGQLQIGARDDRTTAEFLSVVQIAPLDYTFADKLDLKVDFGFNFTQSNSAAQWNLHTGAGYRTRRTSTTVDFDSIFSRQENADTVLRNELNGLSARSVGGRWFTGILGGLLQSEELSLDLRVLLGGSIGRHIVQSNTIRVDVLGGIGYTREQYQGQESAGNNAEAIVATRFEWFFIGAHDTDFSTTFFVFPSLTDGGRVRLELNTKYSRELVGNFTWNVSLFESYDSRPPVEGAQRNDFGINSTLGWSF